MVYAAISFVSEFGFIQIDCALNSRFDIKLSRPLCFHLSIFLSSFHQPLRTDPAGNNCLLHALSLGMWGVHDRQRWLRQRLVNMMVAIHAATQTLTTTAKTAAADFPACSSSASESNSGNSSFEATVIADDAKSDSSALSSLSSLSSSSSSSISVEAPKAASSPAAVTPKMAAQLALAAELGDLVKMKALFGEQQREDTLASMNLHKQIS